MINKAHACKVQIENAQKVLGEQLEFHIKIIHSLPEDLAKEYLIRQMPDIVDRYKRVEEPVSELFGMIKHTCAEIKRFQESNR